MLPVPGFHLRVAAEPPVTVGGDQRFMRNNTSLSQVLPDGTESPIQYAVREQANGQMEFSGACSWDLCSSSTGCGDGNTANCREFNAHFGCEPGCSGSAGGRLMVDAGGSYGFTADFIPGC